MNSEISNSAFRPEILDESTQGDRDKMVELRGRPDIQFLDRLSGQKDALGALLPRASADLLDEPNRWVYYPWRRTVVALLGPDAFRRLRLDRNRNKITAEEQETLARLSVGIVGLSVGHAIAHTLAMEGSVGSLKLADFDEAELSNLNRIPASVFDLGVNKAVVAARRISEIDPYLDVQIFDGGLATAEFDRFFDGLDLVIDECDSLDVKLDLRFEARRRRIPLLMETSDRGLLDVERYDLEPGREPFHGLLGATKPSDLAGLSTRDKAPHVMRIIDAAGLSSRMAASLVDVDETLTTWPQLAGDVQLGGATVAAAVRTLGLGGQLQSGRVRVDLTKHLSDISEPDGLVDTHIADGPVTRDGDRSPAGLHDRVLHAALRAPSGGNSQPWTARVSGEALRIELAPERTSAMDVAFRGSAVAIGAALYNARVAAAAHSVLGPISISEPPDGNGLTADLRFGDSDSRTLAEDYAGVLARETNRNLGDGTPIAGEVLSALRAAATDEKANVCLVTSRRDLDELAVLLAESDRLRYLTPLLHSQMFSELRWPGIDNLDFGLDLRSMELDEVDIAKLGVSRRPEVMAHLAEWDGGRALGDYTRDRVESSSALAVVTVTGRSLTDYARGGSAVERLWISAQNWGLSVQPISPVFLYALDRSDYAALSTAYAGHLENLNTAFRSKVGIGSDESIALVLRLSFSKGTTVRSRRSRAV